MAKDGKKIINTDDGRDTSSVLEGFFSTPETEKAIVDVKKDTTPKNISKAKEAVLVDSLLTEEDKQLLLDEIEQVVLDIDKNFKSVPSSYSDLKKEVIYLSELYQKAVDLSHKTFVGLCERLYIIRDEKLYEEDGFKNFKDFIEKALPFSRSTTYEYLDVYEYFNVSGRPDTEIVAIANNRSKLTPYIKLLKSDKVDDKTKEQIQEKAISQLDLKRAEIREEATKDLIKYNIISNEPKPVKAKAETNLFDSLTNMFGSIKRLSNPKANDAFLLVLEHLEMDNLLSGKELGLLGKEFSKFQIDEE